ncbi:MAG: preprotein translocase subunit SecG [Parcubacteria group bacterium Gr01-1014_13]|nr:MAG: preprotein translocase subunit SecG [Parcubacteria group bacterium Gr01-1014_13]
MSANTYNIIQFVLAALLVTAILLQQKGTGLSGVFGGSSNIYSTKRGVDRILYLSTIVISVIFFGLSLVRLAF